MSKTGKPTKSHAQRGEVFPEVTAPIKVEPTSDDRIDKVARLEKINQVIWGINFAREIMNVQQEVIDRNLAEMIVDAELDLKLF
jgi:hypothetical protein